MLNLGTKAASFLSALVMGVSLGVKWAALPLGDPFRRDGSGRCVPQWPTLDRSCQPFRCFTQVNGMPLCRECYGCGLELAFPPVEAKDMGGWIACWPQG